METYTTYAIQDGREIAKDQNGLGISRETAYTLDQTGAQAVAVVEQNHPMEPNHQQSMFSLEVSPARITALQDAAAGWLATVGPLVGVSPAHHWPPPHLGCRRECPWAPL